MKKLLLLLSLLMPSLGWSQNSFFTDRAVGQAPLLEHITGLIPIQNGQVRVCTFSPNPPIPCVAADGAVFDLNGNPLLVPSGQFGQVNTDVVGRFSFGCVAGQSYTIQVEAQGNNTPTLNYPITCNGSTTGSIFTSITVTKILTPNGGFFVVPSVLVGDGVTDNAAAINAAIVAANGSAAGMVYIPCGNYAVSSAAINMTNQSAVTLKGCGHGLNNTGTDSASASNTTNILCQIAGVCLTTVGSSYLTISDLNIGAPSGSPTTTVIVQGRDNNGGGGAANPFCFAQFNTFRNVSVFTFHSQASNSGFGKIGFYDVGGEEATYDNVTVTADTGYFFLTGDDLNIGSPYQTIQTGCPASMTEVKIMGGAVRILGNDPSAGIFTKGSQSFYISPDFEYITLNSNTAYAIVFGGSTVANWDIHGQFEQLTTNSIFKLNLGVNIDHMNMDVVSSSQSGATQYFTVVTGGQTVSNSRIRVNAFNGTVQPLFSNVAFTWRGGLIDLGTTTCSNLGNVVLISAQVQADGCTDASMAFAGTSQYILQNNTGLSFFNGGGQHKLNSSSGGTLADVNIAQTWTALQGFNDGFFGLNGATSGQLVLHGPATGGGSAQLSPGTETVTIASGTASMTTALIGAGSCGTTVTVAASGVLTTDAITQSFNASTTSNPGVLTVIVWPTANNVNFAYCNPTAAGVTPNAATLNWRVTR